MPRASTRRRASARTEPDPAVHFRFKADRFGFRSTGRRNDAAFARTLIDAVDDWDDTIETLFGDVEAALRHAGEARILPMYPAWSSVRQFRDSIDDQLKARGSKPIDASARFAVEELRLYLGDLSEWATCFQIGVWAATVAGLGSAGPEQRARRLQGLRTLPAVYDIDKAASAEKVLERLKQLRLVSKARMPSALAKAALNPELLTASPGSFEEFAETASGPEPSPIHNWLESLKKDAKSLSDELSSIRSRSLLQDIDKAYWRQWHWLSGTVTRDPDMPEVTILDLVHTARHGNIPVVPTRGGRLSIGQWSRILSLALRPGQIVPENVIEAALHTLRVPILNYTPRGEDNESDPIAAIRPRSAQSFAWSWAPQEGVRALALMPDDVATADSIDDADDEAATDSGAGRAAGEAEDPIEAELAWMRSVDVLEFLELGSDMTITAALRRAPLRMASERILFGYAPVYYGSYYHIDAPEHARDLFDKTRKAYEHLFPVPPPERPSYVYVFMPWLGVWDVLRFLSRWIPRHVRIAKRLVRSSTSRLMQIRVKLPGIGPRRP